jgi:hypothetical protein
MRLVLAALTIAAVNAATLIASPTIESIDTDPLRGGELRIDEALYIRLRYSADTPLRFQARGYRDGVEVSRGARMNPAPPYPAGAGEAIVWIAYAGPMFIDEVRIVVSDAAWGELSQLRLPMDMTWLAGVSPARERPAWIEQLDADQQRMTTAALQAAGDAGPIWSVLPFLMVSSFPSYVWLQARSWRRWTGAWRTAAQLAFGPMAAVLAYTLFALVKGSNLWPLMLMFSMPVAFGYLAALAVARRLFSRSA